MDGAVSDGVAEAVRRGLSAEQKWLPPWLLYDTEGSRLFESITELPSYYVMNAERAVLKREADTLLDAAGPVSEVVELGAGTAVKSQILLEALAERQSVRFVPVDVSAAPMEEARVRMAAALPTVPVEPLQLGNVDALAHLNRHPARRMVLFLGSSIGNLEDGPAVSLLREVARCLGGGALVLGTDLVKPVDVLQAAYDEPEGVTAAFIRNVIVRINRELGGNLPVERFRYVAEWNPDSSRMEMFLVCEGAVQARLAAVDLDLQFADGERIHVESSRKYTLAAVDRLFDLAGLIRRGTWTDSGFAVHVAAAV